MNDPLASVEDVEVALVRPLTPVESGVIYGLIDQASAKLRSAARAIDERIAAFEADATDPAGCDPVVVASVVAGVIKRVLVNPRGAWSTGGETIGPYTSPSLTFPGARAGSGAAESPGGLIVTASDLAQLNPVSQFSMPGTIRTRAPRPGR